MLEVEVQDTIYVEDRGNHLWHFDSMVDLVSLIQRWSSLHPRIWYFLGVNDPRALADHMFEVDKSISKLDFFLIGLRLFG